MPPLPIVQWDEASITAQLRQLRDERPALIPHFVESLKERLILRQDDRTAEVRLNFLRTQIAQLKLAKDFQQTLDDLSLLSLEKAKRVKTLELETHELDLKRRQLTRKEELEALKDQKKLELEIAQFDKQIEEIKTPPPKREPELTPEQKRAEEKRKCDARIAELKAQKQEALKLADEDERLMRVNAIDNALEREWERWSKLL